MNPPMADRASVEARCREIEAVRNGYRGEFHEGHCSTNMQEPEPCDCSAPGHVAWMLSTLRALSERCEAWKAYAEHRDECETCGVEPYDYRAGADLFLCDVGKRLRRAARPIEETRNE